MARACVISVFAWLTRLQRSLVRTPWGPYPFAQPLGPGELDIPAFRNVGGSVMHFIDNSGGLSAIWKVEFNQTGLPGDEKRGPDPDRSSWRNHEVRRNDELVSFLFVHFQYGKTPVVDVIGSDGLFQSQAIETPDRVLRLSLSGATHIELLKTHSLADNLGSTVQHIAFATSDIFASAECMAANGFSPLSIPQNYYEDLAARFDLADDLLETNEGGEHSL